MIDKIPVQFDCEGEHYRGYLTRTFGAANTSTYYLMIDSFYCGQLCMTTNGWAFYGTPKTKHFEKLGEHFGNYLTAWFG